MARQTRQQRRARREQQGAGEQPKALQRARSRQAQVRPASQPVKSQGGQRRVPGVGTKRFIGESWAELKKVEWPGQAQLVQGTAVVLIACMIVGVFLYANDLVWKYVVHNVLLR